MTFVKITLRISISILIVIIFLASGLCAADVKETMKKGLEYAGKGNNAQAITEFTNAISTKLASAEAYYNRGFIYYKEGKIAEAIDDFGKAIEIDKNFVDAYYNRGLANYKKGYFDEAIADYNKVLDLNPEATDALYGRGLAYYKKNKIKEAIADYDKVIAIRPEFPLVYSARAVAYFAKKDYGRTLADVNKAVALGFRSRPLKMVTDENIADTKDKIERAQPVQLGRDQAKRQAWKSRRRMARFITNTLLGLLLIWLVTILILIHRSKKITKVHKKIK